MTICQSNIKVKSVDYKTEVECCITIYIHGEDDIDCRILYCETWKNMMIGDDKAENYNYEIVMIKLYVQYWNSRWRERVNKTQYYNFVNNTELKALPNQH